MSVRDRNLSIEDRIMTLALNSPRLLLTEYFDLNIFVKWRKVIAVMLSQVNNGITPSIATIAQELPNLNESMQEEMAELIWDGRAKPENYSFLIEQLTNGHREISAYKKMTELMSSISEDNPPSCVLSKLGELALTDAVKNQASNPSCDAKGIVAAMDARLDEIAKNKHRYSLATGIEALDRSYSGFQPGKMIVVGANTGGGKTSFATTVMSNMARQGYKVGLISTEQPREEIGFKLNALLSGVSAQDMSLGRITEGADWIKMDKANKELEGYPIYLCDKPEMSVSDVFMQAQAWIAIYGLDLLIIDHLHRLVFEKAKNSNRVIEVGEAAVGVKNIARNLKIPVILLAQLNRAADGKLPTKANLKDSGVIEQEADSILLLSKPTEDDENAVTGVIIGKNRHGKSGLKLAVEFHEETTRWY